MKIIRILLVDDHALLRKGLRLLLDQEADLQVIAEADDGESAIQLARVHEPDVVVMDISLPGLNGIEATRQIMAVAPQTRVLALSIHGEKDFVDDMLVAGASGYLLKESAPEELITAIHEVMGGNVYLSASITKVIVSGYRAVMSDKLTFAVSKMEKAVGPILKTKLYPPPATPDIEQRARLLEQLNKNIQRPLTLISAPAGYGKTVLASQWINSSEYPSAWLSLDENDNDLRVFISYFLAAVLSAFPELPLKMVDMLAVSKLPKASKLAQILVNDLDQIDQPFILVLDDTHRIHNNAIFDLLDLLLRNPPRNLHLVLVGRHDPPFEIVSLRARGQVTEIRTFFLRFTPEETARLMQKMLNREVEPAVAADWAQQTDGWVTALRLAVLSLRHRGKTDDLNLRIRGDSRYLRDYLLAEVLSRMPRVHQDCLIRIAILDRFCVSLCEIMCQMGSDSELASLNGETFINWLQSENLFLIPLDDQHQWFRFHHLFQELLLDMLKSKLNDVEMSALQMRASQWFANNNLIDEAIRYALAAGKGRDAVQLVVEHHHALMNSEQWPRLKRWLDLLPAEVVTQNPFLECAKAFWAIQWGDFKLIVSSVQHAKQLLADNVTGFSNSEMIRAEIAVINSILGLEDQPAQALEQVQSFLRWLPPQALHVHSLAVFINVLSLQMLGDIKGAATIIREELSTNSWPDAFQAKLMHYLCLACIQDGDLNGVLVAARTGLRIAERLSLPETLSWCRYDLGIVHYLRNELAQAEPYLLAMLENRFSTPAAYLSSGIFALALIYLHQGRNSEAQQAIDLLEGTFQENQESSALAMTAAIRVEMMLRQNRLKEAHFLGQGIEYDLIPPHWVYYVPQLTPIKMLLAEGTPESLHKARSRFGMLDEAMRVINRNNVRIEVLNLQALVCAAQGDEPVAIGKLHEALELGVLGGNIRSFVDLGAPMADLLKRLKAQSRAGDHATYIDQILRAFPKAQMPRTGVARFQMDELLTERELEVLVLLTQHLSNNEIAAKLVISPRTIKRHTLNIYRKLDVHSRQQAVQKASELGILG